VVGTYDFDDGTAPWTIGTRGSYAKSVQDGAFVVDLVADGNDFVAYPVPGSQALANGIVMTEVAMSGVGEVGLVARFSANADGTWTTYMCSIHTDGSFACWSDLNDTYTTIVPWQTSAAIVVDGTNVIAMAMHGTTLTFEINGEIVATIDDGTTASGTWGMSVIGGELGFQARFNSVTVAQILE